MITRTAAEMTSEVRDRSDLGDSQFRTDAQIMRYLNEANRQLTAKLIRAFGSDYFEKTGTINTVADTASYDLPSDCYHVKFFRLATSAGRKINIPRANTDDLDIGDANDWGSLDVFPSHRILQNKVMFIPTPQSVHVVTVHYLSTAIAFDGADDSAIAEMSDSSDYINAYWGYEEWVILKAAEKIKHDQEENASDLTLERAEIWRDIEAIAADRITSEPLRIRDGYPDFDDRYPPYLKD